MNYKWTHYLIFTLSTLGESPPPASRTYPGHVELFEKIISSFNDLSPTTTIDDNTSFVD